MRKLVEKDMKKLIWGTIGTLALALGCGAEDSSRDEHGSPRPERAAQGAAAEVLPAGYVQTPSGRYHQSCVHEVPDGALVEQDGSITMAGKLLRAAPSPCAFEVLRNNRAEAVRKPPGDVASKSQAFEIDGWVVYVEAPAINLGVFPVRFNGLESTMTVPQTPTVQLWQLIYVFPSLTPADGKAILQPVLQWGGDPGAKWTAAAWHVDRNRNVFRSTRVNITPGESIKGTVRDVRNSCVGTNCTWQTRLWRGNTALTTLNVQSSEAYAMVQKAAFEAYDVTACRQLPTSTALFMNTKVFAPYDPANVDARIDVTASLTFKKILNPPAVNCAFNAVMPNPQTAALVWSSN